MQLEGGQHEYILHTAAVLAADAAVRLRYGKMCKHGQAAGLGKLFSMVFEDHYPP